MAFLSQQNKISLSRITTQEQRVVVTGHGLITSMGKGKAENAEGFRMGKTAFRPVSFFDVTRQRVGTAGEVVLPESLPRNMELSKRRIARLDRGSVLLLHAAEEALHQAGWSEEEKRESPMPLFLGTSAGGMGLAEKFFVHANAERESGNRNRRGQLARVEGYQSQSQAVNLLQAFGMEGPIRVTANACASGGNAIGQAFRHVKRGYASRVLCGGYDALSQLVFGGFDSLQALTTSGLPRPFDANRDGLALGEGAAVFCLESLDYAIARGSPIIAEISGYGCATDVHHLTQPHPEGDAALSTMTQACQEAEIRPDEVDYINSHGTGTPRNDVAEGRAIQRWAGPATSGISVSSTKAGIGHLLGGAGAVEASICLMALAGNWLPPTATTSTPDEFCTFDLVLEPRDKTLEVVMSNSFGFGGANATLIFRQFSKKQ